MPAKPRTALKTTPVDGRDVTAEIAAFSGKGNNGRARSVTEGMRTVLPKPTFDVVAGGSETLAAAVREQEAEDRRRSDEQTRIAQRQYAIEFSRLNETRAKMGLPPIDPGVELPDADNNADTDANFGGDDARIAGEHVAGQFDYNFQRLRQQAERDAARIRSQANPQQLAPQPVAVGAAPAVPTGVVARQPTVGDVDRLWDWLRQDGEGAQRFLGRTFATTIALHQYMDEIAKTGMGMSLDVRGTHVGFFLLWPIDKANNTAMLHFYLAPKVRGSFPQLFPYILGGARTLVPASMAIAVHSTHPPETMERLLRPFGFVSHSVFVQRGQAGA